MLDGVDHAGELVHFVSPQQEDDALDARIDEFNDGLREPAPGCTGDSGVSGV